MLRIVPIDDVWIRIDCDDAIAQELSEYFQFDVPGSQHMRRVNGQLRHWDAKIRLFKLRTHRIYRGLLPRVLEFAAAREYDVDNRVPTPDPLWKELDDVLRTFKLPFQPDDSQKLALRRLLDNERHIILSPTGSGKSFIIYLMTRLLADCKTLIVVPTIGLVSQLVKDFADYGADTDAEIHPIFAGQEKDADKRIYISTWQSIHKKEAAYFAQFDCIVVDEVHHAKAKSLVHLLEQATKTPYRFGFTGTLEDTECHRLVLEGLLGTISKVTTTNALIKKGRLSPLRVRVCVLEYPDGIKRPLARGNYQDEIEFIVQHAPRQEFLARLVSQLHGNTLILFNFIEKQGIPLHARIEKVCGAHKRVHYIAGSVEGSERERIRRAVCEGDDHVIVASYGTFSTGINIPSLHNIVFAHPAKSKYRVLQSIGRTLRTSEGKTHATLFDLVDDLRWKSWQNHAFSHGAERMSYYSAEKFPCQMMKVPLTMFTVKHAPNAPVDAGATNPLDDDTDVS
jgi:superfamily II DNA or RNA helicase